MKKSKLRKSVARVLPRSARSFGGKWWVWFFERAIRPVLGLIFDLKGGCFRVDGCEIEVPKELTTRTYRGCFMIDDYEFEERSLIKRHLRKDDSVLELGACIGAVSCTTNKLLARESRHVVVEGNPKLIPYLEKNRDRNQGNFTVLNRAASEDDSVTFYLDDEYIVGGTTQRTTNKPVTVPGSSLADLSEEFGGFSALIMDIEGAEADVIPPATEFLKTCRLVVVETHDWACGAEKTEECRKAMAAAGLVHRETQGDTEAWVRPDTN